MKLSCVFVTPALVLVLSTAAAIQPPTELVSRTGDQSIVLHWGRNAESNTWGYRVYRSSSKEVPFSLLNSSPVTMPGYCDLTISNGQTNYYQVTAVTTGSEESSRSETLEAVAHPFADDDEFLDYIQQTSFDYFCTAPTLSMDWCRTGARRLRRAVSRRSALH